MKRSTDATEGHGRPLRAREKIIAAALVYGLIFPLAASLLPKLGPETDRPRTTTTRTTPLPTGVEGEEAATIAVAGRFTIDDLAARQAAGNTHTARLPVQGRTGLLLPCPPSPIATNARSGPSAALYQAIEAVETGGNNPLAVGDNGRARGPYQIRRPYWLEACRTGGVVWDYDTLVWSREYCQKIMAWYWNRHGADTDEARARMHNGGPGWSTGARRPLTADYWARVRALLQAAGEGDTIATATIGGAIP